MCGIVGILSTKPVAPVMLDVLKHLEYRGYDSAGAATLVGGKIKRRRAEGKLKELQCLLERSPLPGVIGIGHTRWATHGAATEINAHPHATDRVALVHNGIIENFRSLRAWLENEGAVFQSETDSEVVPHLITHYLNQQKTPEEAFKAALSHLKGAYALVALFAGEEDMLIAARSGSPLVIGHSSEPGEVYVCSDALGLVDLTDQITYLEDGDWAVITRSGITIYDKNHSEVERPRVVVAIEKDQVDKGGYPSFMLKEIYGQPDAVSRTFAKYIDFAQGTVCMPQIDLMGIEQISIIGCGTAYYAGLVAKYWMEEITDIPVSVEVASEFRYRKQPHPESTLVIVISQSGETADTLMSLRHAKECGQQTLGIINVESSTMAREVDILLPTYAGVEMGVASTVAFTCQLAVLACFTLACAREVDAVTLEDERAMVAQLEVVPGHMSKVLQLNSQIEILAHQLAQRDPKHMLVLGRAIGYPLAMEGALKIKEITYIHAEGYPAGELKHGPIALVDPDLEIMALAPTNGEVFEKMISAIHEVRAKGAKRIILLTDEKGAGEAGIEEGYTVLVLPNTTFLTAPFLYIPPLQLLACHTAQALGRDVDQPRNLAKSVTVE